MALEQVIYNLEEVKGLSDEELYQRLYDSWGLENHKIDVWGELSINEAGNWAGIRNAKTLSGNQSIEYPLWSGQQKLATELEFFPVSIFRFVWW